MVPYVNNIGSSTDIFARIVNFHQVRLASVGTPTEPRGYYRCVVPDGKTGETVSAGIFITAAPLGIWLIQEVNLYQSSFLSRIP